MVDDCIFCKISRGDVPSERIYENGSFFSIRDVHPVSTGHSLVISKKHFVNVLDLPSELGVELIDAIKKTVFRLKEEVSFEGFNVIQNNFVVAGQVVNHLHFHVVPREDGDGLKGVV